MRGDSDSTWATHGSSRARELALLGAMVLVAGCTVGPTFTRPDVPTRPSWSPQGDPRVAAQAAIDQVWWKSFNDPALDNLVELAYHQNLPLQIAGLRIIEARAQLAVATGRSYPQVQQLFGNAEAVGVPLSAALPGGDRNYFDFQLGFDAAWELDFWGKYRRGVEAETNNLIATEADYASGIISVTAEVARSYIQLRTFEVLIQQEEDNVKLQQDTLNIAESRFRNGAISELDVTQARTLLESTRANIPQLRIGVQQSRNALSTLLGQPPGTIDALLNGPKELPKPPAKVALDVPAELLRRRPDIRRAEFSAAAQCARVGVAESTLYPSFSLLGTIGLDSTAGRGTAFKLFSTDSIFYSVGPTITWPFFNYGRLRNSVRVEDARFEELLVNYRDTVVRADEEVENSLSGFLNNQESLGYQQASVVSAQRSVEIALVQYREGATDYQRVLDAQRSLLQQQVNLIQTSSAISTSLVGLYKALGGGWELRQGQPLLPQQVTDEMKARTSWDDMFEPVSPPQSSNPTQSEQH